MSAPRPLARIVPKVAGKALGKRGMAFGTLITDWATIMGPELARSTLPQKLAFPTRPEGGCDTPPQGYRLGGTGRSARRTPVDRANQRVLRLSPISQIRLIQGPIPGAPRRPKIQRPMTPEEEAGIQQATSPIEDEELRKSLARLGRAVYAKTSK